MSNPFARPGLLSGRQVVDLIADRSDISQKNTREIASAWNSASEWLGIPLEKLLAHHANLRPRLARLTPGKCGVTKKTIANVRRLLKLSIRLVAPNQNSKSFKAPYTQEIEKLLARIDRKYTSASLNCLFRYISARRLRLRDVDDRVVAALLAAMLDDGLQKRPRIIHQNACRAWNKLRRRFPKLCLQQITVPRYSKRSALKTNEVPAHLRKESSDFLARGVTTDPFDLNTPISAWSPSTLRTYDTQLRRYLGWLVSSGVDLNTLPTLCDAARLDLVVETFDKQGLRNNSRGRASAAGIAFLLHQICQDASRRAPDEAEKAKLAAQSAELKKLSRRLRQLRERSPKNRERLAQLRHDANLARLFLLPFALDRELSKVSTPKRVHALLMQWTVALCILTFCPLRISALCSIRLDRHLNWARPGMKGSLRLEYGEGELKNGEPASLPLPAECARMIRNYVHKFRHLLADDSDPHLFSGASAAHPKLPGVLSGQLSRLIDDRTGLPVNPHLYRHIVHLIVLRRFPGAYAMVARVLTHRSIATTIKNYSYFDAELATAAYQKLVAQVQDGTVEIGSAASSAVAYQPEKEY